MHGGRWVRLWRSSEVCYDNTDSAEVTLAGGDVMRDIGRVGRVILLVAAAVPNLRGAALTQADVAARTTDAAVLHVSACVYAAREPRVAEIDVDVAGRDEISLIAWSGGDASICDYANWLEARFEGENGTVYLSDVPWAFA